MGKEPFVIDEWIEASAAPAGAEVVMAPDSEHAHATMAAIRYLIGAARVSNVKSFSAAVDVELTAGGRERWQVVVGRIDEGGIQ